jgi:hypothetical protein
VTTFARFVGGDDTLPKFDAVCLGHCVNRSDPRRDGKNRSIQASTGVSRTEGGPNVERTSVTPVARREGLERANECGVLSPRKPPLDLQPSNAVGEIGVDRGRRLVVARRQELLHRSGDARRCPHLALTQKIALSLPRFIETVGEGERVEE